MGAGRLAPRHIRWHRSANSMPTARADWGSRLVAVSPGRVFTSKQQRFPSGVKRKSTRE